MFKDEHKHCVHLRGPVFLSHSHPGNGTPHPHLRATEPKEKGLGLITGPCVHVPLSTLRVAQSCTPQPVAQSTFLFVLI